MVDAAGLAPTTKDKGKTFTVRNASIIRVGLQGTSNSPQDEPYSGDYAILLRTAGAAMTNGDSTATFRAIKEGKSTILAQLRGSTCGALTSATPTPCGSDAKGFSFIAYIVVKA